MRKQEKEERERGDGLNGGGREIFYILMVLPVEILHMAF